MNQLYSIHALKCIRSCLLNGDDVRIKHIPSSCNYCITDNNLRLPLRFPQFSSEGEARGIATNYRLFFSPVTWYLNGQRPPCYQIKLYTVCLSRDLRWRCSTTHYLWHSNKSWLLIKTVVNERPFSNYTMPWLLLTTAN